MPVNPPAKPSAPASRTPRKPVQATPIRSSRAEARKEALDGIGRIASLVAVMKGWYADAGAIAQHGPGFTRGIADMAESNDKLASWLDYLTESGPYMEIFAAGLPLALQLAANHGKIDPTKLPPESGIVEPKILEERVKAEMALASARVLQEIRSIQAQAEQAQAEGIRLTSVPQAGM